MRTDTRKPSKQPKENPQVWWILIVFVVRERTTFKVIVIFQIYQSTGSQKKVRGATCGIWWHISDGPRWQMEEVNFFSSLLVLKVLGFTQTQGTSYSIRIGYPRWLGFYNPTRATCSIDYPQEPFRATSIYSSCLWMGKRGGVWLLLLRRSPVMASLTWTSKHCIWTEVTPCLNTEDSVALFLTKKLLNLAISLCSSQTFS